MLATIRKISLAAALTAITLLAGSAVAGAHPAAISHKPPNSVVVIARVHSDLPVGAGATGDGPATDADCQGFADSVNMVLDAAQSVLQNIGNTPLYDKGIDLARQIESDAENAGCFIINPV